MPPPPPPPPTAPSASATAPRHNLGPSVGRVPEYHGDTVDGEGTGARRSVFGDQMWAAYR